MVENLLVTVSVFHPTPQHTMALIFYVTQVQFDFGAVSLLKQECARVGITRPLIVTDPGVKAAGVLQKALDALPGLPVAVFDQTPSNPTEAAVRAAVAAYHANQCDGLIAVGGGSAIDCAKGVAIAATHEGPLTHYATIEGGSPRISERVAPIIAVPTTSGTGSEVARGAIIIVDDHRKLGFHSWHLVPKTAICDPELTFGLPPSRTAWKPSWRQPSIRRPMALHWTAWSAAGAALSAPPRTGWTAKPA
jgi:4-hydroxybutyrate dehydrogenase